LVVRAFGHVNPEINSTTTNGVGNGGDAVAMMITAVELCQLKIQATFGFFTFYRMSFLLVHGFFVLSR